MIKTQLGNESIDLKKEQMRWKAQREGEKTNKQTNKGPARRFI